MSKRKQVWLARLVLSSLVWIPVLATWWIPVTRANWDPYGHVHSVGECILGVEGYLAMASMACLIVVLLGVLIHDLVIIGFKWDRRDYDTFLL